MNQGRAEQLKLLRDQSENELEDVSFDEIFKKEEPGPDAKVQMDPEGEKAPDIPLKSTQKDDSPGPE